MMPLAREALLYAAMSAAAFCVDVATLVALVELAGVPYLPAAVAAFLVGGLVAYALCVRFVFSFRRIANRRIEAGTFVALGTAGLIVNAAGIVIGVEWLSLHYLAAKVSASCIGFFVNYALRRLILFTRAQSRPE
jgi:putative flippase GtrA